jgi:hypothetical protein
MISPGSGWLRLRVASIPVHGSMMFFRHFAPLTRFDAFEVETPLTEKGESTPLELDPRAPESGHIWHNVTHRDLKL